MEPGAVGQLLCRREPPHPASLSPAQGPAPRGGLPSASTAQGRGHRTLGLGPPPPVRPSALDSGQAAHSRPFLGAGLLCSWLLSRPACRLPFPSRLAASPSPVLATASALSDPFAPAPPHPGPQTLV